MLASRASFRISSAMDDEHCVLVHSTYTECQSALYTADWISNSRGKYCLGPITPRILNTSGRIIRNAKRYPARKTHSIVQNRNVLRRTLFLRIRVYFRILIQISKAQTCFRKCFPRAYVYQSHVSSNDQVEKTTSCLEFIN